MSKFDRAFAQTVDAEGGLSLDPEDKGNWTGGQVGAGELRGSKFGISAASYPNLDISSLTLKQARDIYIKDFWNLLNLEDLPAPLGAVVFDAAVNHGPGNAVRLLQRALRVAADGQIGPVTMAAYRSTGAEATTVVRFMAYRIFFWADLKAWSSQGRGWARRGARMLLNACDNMESAP